MQKDSSEQPQLRRALGLFALTAFGVGDILGAGVYGLVGKIAGLVGNAAWMAYVVAGITAALTGLTYAEYTSRYPKAGGAAHFCQAVYRNSLVTFIVIFCVGLSGLFSMATSSKVFAKYALAAVDNTEVLREYIMPITFVVIISVVAFLGIILSSAANIVCSVIEILGLAVIIFVGARFLGSVDYTTFTPSENQTSMALVFSGASLAFFAFIGFEDMANLSEEVKDPERNVPMGICLAIVITSSIYCLIALVAVSVLRPPALAATGSPLLDVVSGAAPGFPVWIYKMIPAFAVFNTALLNLMMASRLMYGMARGRNNLLPQILSHVHPRWRTPGISILFCLGIVIVLILSTKDISVLANGTTCFLLIVFLLLHVGLIFLKLRKSGPVPRFRVPIVIPVFGILTCAVLLVNQSWKSIGMAGIFAAAGFILYWINYAFRDVRHVDAVD